MRILTYKWKAYNQRDIEHALKLRGHEVVQFDMEMGNFEKDKNFEKSFTEVLSERFDMVFTVNYFPLISDICESKNIPYVCWTCDSPLSTMYHQSIFNSCNHIFVFDMICALTFRDMGVNVHHLPLAAAVERAQYVLEAAKNPDKQTDDLMFEEAKENMYRATDISHDVSFVGSMYRKNSYDEICDKLPDYIRGYFDALMKLQLEIYGENYIDMMLDGDIIAELNKHFNIEKSDRSFSDISLIFSTTVLGFKIAQLERYKMIELLSRYFDVQVYTDDENAEFLFAKNCGPVDYWSDSPCVFNESKINLNFTIRNIKSGIPLRVWDILAAGGFCITNFQRELPLFFKNGEDLVWFEDENDLVEKVRYYLEHEDERKKIARNGYEKVRRFHTYNVRINEIAEKTGLQL